MSILARTTEAFADGLDLGPADAERLFDAMIAATDEEMLGGLFRAWNAKGIAAEEIFAVAEIMRERCTRISFHHGSFVDIVGTGGSKAKTFNVSTAAAFVVAGAGVAVAKHGNKAATSNSGSADVLSELGVEYAVDAKTAERNLNEIGICFMFAPNFHRLSPTLALVRRGLGFPTVFNCVGPLCNPASAPHQVIGVWDGEMVGRIAAALARLGTQGSLVVHGDDGLDEITIAGETTAAAVSDGNTNFAKLTPAAFGIAKRQIDECRVASARESAEIVRLVLKNEARDSAAEELVLINAAAALRTCKAAATNDEAMSQARASLRSGEAFGKLRSLTEAGR